MKGIIVYESRYGATKTYAHWLSEALGFEVFPAKKVKDFSAYDTIIVGSWIRAGTPAAKGWIMQNWNKMKDKKVLLFSTSAAPRDDPEIFDNFKSAFPEEIRLKMPYYPLGGKKIIGEMNWLDQKLMRFLVKMIAKKSPMEAAKLAEDVNRMNQADIKPVIDYVKGI